MSDSSSSSDAAKEASGGWGLWNSIKATSTQLESTVSSLVGQDNTQIKSKLAEWGSAAGKYLDAADDRIGEFESNANSYLKGIGSDIKSFIDTQVAPMGGASTAGATAGVELFNADVAPNRLEQDLHSLHTNAKLFEQGAKDDSDPKLDAKEQTTKYPELAALHDKLVPKQLTSNQFWNKYEQLRKPILEQDEKRKKIISQQPEEEDEGWGSSEEN